MTHHRHVTARTIDRLALSLSTRDHLVLQTLEKIRAASADQLERLHFENVTRRQARASLSSPTHRRLITRLPRRIGGTHLGGSLPYVYGLDVAGHRLLARTDERVRRPWALGASFIDHTLAVTETYVRLAEADRAGRLQLVAFDAEPSCWRSFPGSGGGRQTLKPDAYVVTRQGRYEDRWFIEADRASKSLATVARKIAFYQRCFQSGVEQQRSGVFPQVLWLVPTQRRFDQLTDLVSRTDGAGRLHDVAVADDVIARIERGAGQ